MVKEGRAFFAAAAITSCRPDGEPKVPETIAVGPYLDKPPIGLAEEYNSSDSKYPLRGAVAGCRAKKECVIPLYAWQTIVSLKFSPEENGHLDITWVGMRDEWLTFRMRVDFNLREQRESYQRIAVGESKKLFNTDLVVTPQKSPSGNLYLKVER
jgi:hypothetical protein